MNSEPLGYNDLESATLSTAPSRHIIHLSDYILNNQDKGEYTGMVVIDLQKAFDTVNHKILLSKPQALGLDQVAIKWFASYLEDRQQIVQIGPGDTHSDSCSIKCGVPQGSTIVFNLY